MSKPKSKYLPGHNPGSAKGQGMKAKAKKILGKGLLHVPASDPNFISGIKDFSDGNLKFFYEKLVELETTEHGHMGRIAAVEKELRLRKEKKPTEKIQNKNTLLTLSWKPLLGVRDKNKITALFAQIEENEKAALKLIVNTAKVYYDAGNILAGAISKFERPLTAKNICQSYDFPERKITLALKIFKHFENNPDALKGLTMRDAIKMIAPPPPAGEDGYNRIDLGGDPGQMKFDFGELFTVPATANQSLKNYRTVGDLVSEIILVRRTNDGKLISKRFAHFCEDVPQNPLLRQAYKAMSQKTQAAIEDYLAALEQEEA
jgi:hypothetical protein